MKQVPAGLPGHLAARRQARLFQVDAEDMKRLEQKVDAISERLGLDTNTAGESAPEQEQSP